ncbi:ShlB/FhaC/HecB family hemolysin secretion/activation protein [Caulobacter sp.]|uniref:ShlB/FhaC/HecB family hemolysin secretion/activation protein n=1 Tax=Caulobacter sp. TaxID=78 RepID=UPI001B030648|nr:ShlB/FhaC/HecB family hemolysin secretion/activation protein [Caulobacter sp.]MBO9547158.1 ShlB/FhaC/HecB family hemolysin secretion/activation protein [Caulobacter sp.]
MLKCTLLVAAALALPLSVHAQTSTSRVVPQDRPDQNPRASRAKPAPGPRAPRGRMRSTPVAPFQLQDVRIEGSTLPIADLQAAWRPFVGQTVDTKGLVKITDAVARLYEREGYAIYTVLVPDQTFEGGVLRLRALEGYISEAVVTAPNAKSRALADQYVARLKVDRPLKRRTLERYVSLIRDIPGTSNEMVLENGDGDNGVRLKMALKPRPVQVAVSVNNRGTAYLGRTQVQADLYLNSLLRSGDQTRFTVAVPTDIDRFRSYSIGHVTPLGSNGLSLGLNAGYLKTKPAVGGLVGHAKSAGAQLSYPIIRGYERDLYVNVSIDGVDSDNAFLGYTFANDKTRAARAALSTSVQKDRSLWYVSATVSQGIDGLGARTDPALAKLAFRKLNVRGGAAWSIGKQGALRVNAAGQTTSDRLPGTEQFAVGGDEFGRGYEASVIAGDSGVAASAELAFVPAKPPKGFGGSELYSFIDGGKVRYRGRFGYATSHADLRSAGGGVRVRIQNKAIVQVEAAKALSNDIAFLDGRAWRGVVSVKTVW